MSASSALNKYYAGQIKKTGGARGAKRSNKKPEAALQREAIRWLNSNGFDCSSVESKAVYSQAAGSYLRGQTDPGFPDIAGVCPDFGVGCFIELKAPGKRASLKDHQRMFLERKIDKYAFAICADSVEYIGLVYARWLLFYRANQLKLAAELLKRELPIQKARKLQDLGLDR